MQKGFVVLLIYAVLITIGLVVAVIYIVGLFSSNNDLVERLETAERNISGAREAERNALARVDAIERRNAELEKAGTELAEEVRKIVTGFQGWENRYRRIAEILDRSREFFGERAAIVKRIEEENHLTAN